MTDSRTTAHTAMRNLWEVADRRLAEPDATERQMNDFRVREVETEKGAKICSFSGRLTVRAEFEKTDGTDETVEVWFADDIRDLSESEVRIEWRNNKGAGTNTPALRDYPILAEELRALI